MTDTLTHILYADIDRLKAENEKFYRDWDEIDRFLLHHAGYPLIDNLIGIREAQKGEK